MRRLTEAQRRWIGLLMMKSPASSASTAAKAEKNESWRDSNSPSRPFSFPRKPHFHLFVNADRIEHFRKRLQDLAEEISNDLAANKDDAGIVELDTSIGRLSRMDAMQNQQMALELRRRRENQLLRIKNAFKRMDKGHYGKCGKCGKPIDEARLEVFPDVVTCVACA